jgi:hypothetical protein
MSKQAYNVVIVGAEIVGAACVDAFSGRRLRVASQFLREWPPDAVRPPAFSARVESLAIPAAQQSIPALTGELQ